MQSNSNRRHRGILGAGRCLEAALWGMAEGYGTPGLSPGALVSCRLSSSPSACGCPVCSCTAWGSEGVLLHHCQSKTKHLNAKAKTSYGLCYYQVPASLLEKSGAGPGDKHVRARALQVSWTSDFSSKAQGLKSCKFYPSLSLSPCFATVPCAFLGCA